MTKFTVYGLLALLVFGCAKVRAIYDVPEISFGEATSFPTIEALTDAPIVGGNKLEILQNGDGTFPVMPPVVAGSLPGAVSTEISAAGVGRVRRPTQCG